MKKKKTSALLVRKESLITRLAKINVTALLIGLVIMNSLIIFFTTRTIENTTN